ncbi:trifunctional serine/threonine-protein kinase/ATP-binding protein/sensor histidine kinase [Cupriavidus agavae]|uniref:histidine kinase n=1 Tax=Cupriavidus agavae TaxID=1001822 RepID=A0A4Q7RE02_9BURK|nr:AAA family ATPase [Cupriavidus agavae]RZT31393.1 serine/threonine protein kinase and signal transduction histidine kinase with GAF sensor [Cupriavidus agavae]
MPFPKAEIELGFDSTWEAGDRMFGRGRALRGDDSTSPVLGVWAADDHRLPETFERLAHEHALRDDLDPAWAAVPQDLLRERGQVVLLLADPGGEPLSRLIDAPLPAAAFLDIAIATVMAVCQLHQRGLIHKDLKPAHVLVAPDRSRVWLTGFGIASRMGRGAVPMAEAGEIAGTLAYMAPEQTGRMHRAIDTRTDLYALGVLFYRMLTGTLPFSATDPLDWVHWHLAREAVPPAEQLGSVPAMLSAMVMKLLAKPAEDRYQTTAGLLRDLQRCQRGLAAEARIEPFQPGEHDISDTLVIPEFLYGRAPQLATLAGTLDRVAATGRSESVVVSGPSGAGKTAVVQELQRTILQRRGLYAAAKADLAGRGQDRLPYSTLAQALRGLLRELLALGEAEQAPWRGAIAEALGPNAGLLVPLLPELDQWLGPAPWTREAPSREVEARLRLALQSLVGALAGVARPLTLCLDDAQWLDAGTAVLLRHLLTAPGEGHLLLVSAYRTDAIDDAQALPRGIAAWRERGAAVTHVALGNLDAPDLHQLVADTLHCSPGSSAPLARVVMEKTAGNPFFVTHFLAELADGGLLRFDHVAARWTWEIGPIEARGFTDNVVSLMVDRIGRLPASTRAALELLACLGNDIPDTLLRQAWDGDAAALDAALAAAVQMGLITRQDRLLRFCHDRMLAAAYARLPEPDRPGVHLRIGRQLLARLSEEEIDANVFTVAGQLNRAAGLIESAAERDRLAELNLAAALRARTACANAAALHYLSAGVAMLSADAFGRCHALAFSLTLHLAECEFLTGDVARAEQRLDALAARIDALTELAVVTQVKLGLLLTSGRRAEAVAVGLDYLARAGIAWTAEPLAEAVAEEEALLTRQLAGREIASLEALPAMSDPGALATMRVLTALLQPAWYSDEHLRGLVILRMVNLSVARGNSDESCLGYAWLAMLRVAASPDNPDGAALARLAQALAERHGVDRFRARVCQVVGGNLLHWTQPLRVARGVAREGLALTQQIGDLTYAAYLRSNLITHALAIGDPLGRVLRDAESGSVYTWGPRFALVADRLAPQRQLVRTLRGLTPVFGRFDDDDFDERAFEARLPGDVGLRLAACWYWIRKLQARYLAGDGAAACAAAERAAELLWTSPAYFEQAEYHFYAALARAACCNPALDDDLALHLPALAGHHRQLARWARHCPATFGNRAALVAAEIARLEGRDVEAMRGYEAAIASARDSDLIHMQALANELAGRFYMERGIEHPAAMYLREARHCYLHWGADAKVWQLDARYPQLVAGAGGRSAAAPAMGTIGAPLQHLDLATVMAVSEAVSGEVRLDRLMEMLLRTALEQAGATRGLLILPSGGHYRVAAEAGIRDHAVTMALADRPLDASDLPLSVINHVLQAREHMVFDDVAAQRPFTADPYIRQRRARSMLCLPLLNQGKLAGVLYLDNALAPGVFGPARTEVIKLLAFQAASALENSRLFEARRQADEALRQAQSDLAHVGRVMTLSALTTSIAHEVSQPIAAMTIEANAALRWLRRERPNVDEAIESLSGIVRQGQRARSVIAGMRAMLRNAAPQAQPLDLNALVDESVPLFGGELTRHRISLKTDLAGDLPQVRGDKVQLQQVFLNLAINAIEAMRDVVDHARDLTVRTAVGAGGEVLLSVHDVGVGLPGDPAQMFEAFYTTKPEGMGMGLAICRSILETHGGDLHAWPNWPAGAVFGFALPPMDVEGAETIAETPKA